MLVLVVDKQRVHSLVSVSQASEVCGCVLLLKGNYTNALRAR